MRKKLSPVIYSFCALRYIKFEKNEEALRLIERAIEVKRTLDLTERGGNQEKQDIATLYDINNEVNWQFA